MNKSSTLKLTVLLLSTVLATASIIHAKQTNRQPPSQSPGSPQAKQPKKKKKTETLQLLKGMPQPQIMEKMRGESRPRGVMQLLSRRAQFGHDTPPSRSPAMLRDYDMGWHKTEPRSLQRFHRQPRRCAAAGRRRVWAEVSGLKC